MREKQSLTRVFSLYLRPAMLTVLALGFSSGLPLALTSATLSIWLFEMGLDIAGIGVFAAVALPYNLKFLWSPLMDGFRVPVLCALLGRRRGWLIATQLATAGAIVALCIAGISENPWLIGLAALAVAFCSASQDIVVDAYRVERLAQEEQAHGAAVIVLGYRLGMLVSMAGALYLASYLGWALTYLIMAALMGVGMLTTMLAREPDAVEKASATQAQRLGALEWLRIYVVRPFADFMGREHWLLILLFVFLYKFGDAFMGLMPNVFYVQTGFSKEQIAGIAKLYGVLATIAGGFIGAFMASRFGLMKSLWICGIAQALANVMFIMLARVGADIVMLAATITIENMTGGMGTAVFVAYISGLANRRFTATQYALLSSLAALARTVCATPSGWLAKQLGWEGFFLLSILLAVPGLMVLALLQRRMATAPGKTG